MKARTAVGIMLSCVLAILSVVNGGAASAQFTFERSPAEGPRGTVIKVSGTGCIEGGKPYQQAHIHFYRRAGQEGGGFDTFQDYPIRSDGTWSGDLVVPQEAPPGNYGIGVTCEADDMSFPVGEADFVVNSDPPIPPPSTTTTTTSTSTSTTTTTTTTAQGLKSTTTSTPPAAAHGAARGSGSTTTSQVAAPSTGETTTTTPATAAQGEVDDKTTAAAPASTDRRTDSGGGLGWLLVVLLVLGLLAVASVPFVLRRRRQQT